MLSNCFSYIYMLDLYATLSSKPGWQQQTTAFQNKPIFLKKLNKKTHYIKYKIAKDVMKSELLWFSFWIGQRGKGRNRKNDTVRL